MRGFTIFALVAIGMFLSGCANPQSQDSNYTLNGQMLSMKGPQKLVTPKGIDVEVEGTGINVTLVGEEEISINGRKFRAYGKKIEVNGDAYPVGPGKTLVVDDEGVHILGAGGSGGGGEE